MGKRSERESAGYSEESGTSSRQPDGSSDSAETDRIPSAGVSDYGATGGIHSEPNDLHNEVSK